MQINLGEYGGLIDIPDDIAASIGAQQPAAAQPSPAAPPSTTTWDSLNAQMPQGRAAIGFTGTGATRQVGDYTAISFPMMSSGYDNKDQVYARLLDPRMGAILPAGIDPNAPWSQASGDALQGKTIFVPNNMAQYIVKPFDTNPSRDDNGLGGVGAILSIASMIPGLQALAPIAAMANAANAINTGNIGGAVMSLAGLPGSPVASTLNSIGGDVANAVGATGDAASAITAATRGAITGAAATAINGGSFGDIATNAAIGGVAAGGGSLIRSGVNSLLTDTPSSGQAGDTVGSVLGPAQGSVQDAGQQASGAITSAVNPDNGSFSVSSTDEWAPLNIPGVTVSDNALHGPVPGPTPNYSSAPASTALGDAAGKLGAGLINAALQPDPNSTAATTPAATVAQGKPFASFGDLALTYNYTNLKRSKFVPQDLSSLGINPATQRRV